MHVSFDGTVSKLYGPCQNTDVFEVLEGLNPGDRVITSSYDTFGDIDKLVIGE